MSESNVAKLETKNDPKCIIEAQVRRVAGVNAKFAGDALDELNRKVVQLIRDAVSRAGNNDRVTVKAHDF